MSISVRNQFPILCFAALALACATPAPAQNTTPKTTVLVEKAEIKPDRVRKRYIGRIEAIETVAIQPRVSGNILDTQFREGGMVRKGQVLFEIEDTQYKARVRNAQAQVARLEARLAYAQSSYERYSRLVRTDSVSQDTVDNAKAEYDTLKAEKMAAEAELVIAEDNLNYTRITTPITGRVGRVSFSAGNYITPQSGPLLTVTSMEEVYVRFPISVHDFLNLFGTAQNMKDQAVVSLTLANGKPYPVEGAVVMTDNQAQSMSDSFNVWAKFRNPDEILVPGGVAAVDLSKKDVENLVAVPVSAIMYEDKKACVYVLSADDKVERREVGLGNMIDNTQFLISGVKEGETVIIDGMHKTIPGSIVQPVYSKK